MKLQYVISGLAGAIILGLVFMLIFINYGGNNCDQPPAMTCDCFCCDMFGLRGYESCANFGLILGVITGAVLGVLAIKFFRK